MSEDHITYSSQNAENSDIQRVGRFIISLIIVAYFSIVFIEVCPNNSIRDRARAYVDPIILLFGLKQRWNLFSPGIRTMNQYATALVTFKDGTVKLYEWPENRKIFFSDINRNQLRKFIVDGVNEPFYSAYWPDSARFLAKIHWNPDNPPVFVETVFNGIDVPKFSSYTKQSELNLLRRDHLTIQLPMSIRTQDLPRGGSK